MKLPWSTQRNRIAKTTEQIHSRIDIPASKTSYLGILGRPGRLLKKLFSKKQNGLHKQQHEAPVGQWMNAVEPATSSLDDRRLFIEPEGLESSHDLLPLIDDTGVVEVSESNTNASAEEQKDCCGDGSRGSGEASRPSLDTVIVQPREAVVFSETLSNASASEGGYIWFNLAQAQTPETAFARESLSSLDFLDVPVFFDTTNDVSRTEDEGSRYEDQDAGRPFRLRHTEEPLSSERHSASIAAYAAPGLHYQPYQDEVQGDMLAGPRHLNNDVAVQGFLPHVPRLRSSVRQANRSSPMHLYPKNFEDIENLLRQDRPFRSVGPWRAGTPFPNVVLSHARELSGTTAVDRIDIQGELRTSYREVVSNDEHLLTPAQAQGGSEHGLREDIDEHGLLIDISAISPDVQWETILESRQTSHENEMADLVEDHAAAMDELRGKNANQVQRLERRLAHVLGVNKRLQKEDVELRKRQDEHAKQVQRKDEVLQQVVANRQDLQLRYEELQQRFTQQGGGEVLSETDDNEVSEGVTQLKGIVRRQDQIIGNLHERNQGLTAALAKYKAESDFNLAKLYQLTYVIEDKPLSDPEKDRLLEYKDKMYKDLDVRCSETIIALEATVQNLEKEAELDKARTSEEINALKAELERKSRLNSDLQTRKDAFRDANKSIFDMRKRTIDDTGFQKALNEIYEVAEQDNVHLEHSVEGLTKDLSEVRIELASLQSTIRALGAAEDKKAQTIATLEEQKSALECDLGRLQIEAEILPTEHEEALAHKDAEISHYKQQAELSNQEKNSFINSRLDSWVRYSLQSKENEISQLRGRVEELYFDSCQLRYRMDKMAEIRAQDADYAFADGVESQLNKDRTKAAEEEAAKLSKELADLREYHNPIRNKEDKDIEEVLQESEELQRLHTNIESELRNKVDYLSTRLKEGITWAHAVKDVGGNLLARISRLEHALQFYGIQDDDDQRDMLITRYNNLLDFVEDKEIELEAETEAPIPGTEQIMADFEKVLADAKVNISLRTPAKEPICAKGKPNDLSAVAAGKVPETPNTRAQRIIAEKERARGIFFDSNGRVKSRVHTTMPKPAVEVNNPFVQEEGDSLHMTSSAWARRYSPPDEAGPSNAQDESFF